MTQPTKMQELAAHMSIEYDEDWGGIAIVADGLLLATINRDGMWIYPGCDTVLAPAGITFDEYGRIKVQREIEE